MNLWGDVGALGCRSSYVKLFLNLLPPQVLSHKLSTFLPSPHQPWESKIVNNAPWRQREKKTHKVGHQPAPHFVCVMSEKLTASVGSLGVASVRGIHGMKRRRKGRFCRDPKGGCKSETNGSQTRERWKSEKMVP